MLRTAWPGLEARDTCVPGCRRMGVGLPAGRRNQLRFVVSRLLTRVRFRVVPGVCTQEFGLSLPGTAGRQEAGAPWSRNCGPLRLSSHSFPLFGSPFHLTPSPPPPVLCHFVLSLDECGCCSPVGELCLREPNREALWPMIFPPLGNLGLLEPLPGPLGSTAVTLALSLLVHLSQEPYCSLVSLLRS